MRYTSINHTKTSNYQVDYEGSLQTCVKELVRWCKKYDVIWAMLAEEEAGIIVAYYNKAGGCKIIE